MRLTAGFRTVTAVALSNVTIVGGTLTNFAFNVGRRHPLRPGPLIDWDLILVMEPSTILGALAGGYINHVRGDFAGGICWWELNMTHGAWEGLRMVAKDETAAPQIASWLLVSLEILPNRGGVMVLVDGTTAAFAAFKVKTTIRRDDEQLTSCPLCCRCSPPGSRQCASPCS